ncbi:MAG: MotB family protein [Hyphomicrobiales bacterium]|nr:MotB family protein [Hyphomicrobiales bacterium]
MSDEEESHDEIIIVRRVSGDHDEHHGGAWKVAFADFMTAMMAFFLVMWLINSSSEETKRAVASYFNPIKLTDRISNPKGKRTPKYGDVSEEEVENEEESTIISNSKVIAIKGEGVAKTFDEQALFANPYALLAEISSELDVRVENTDSENDENARSSELGISGGDAFKDPFDPSSWNMNYNNVDRNKEMAQLEEQLDDQVESTDKGDSEKIIDNLGDNNIDRSEEMAQLEEQLDDQVEPTDKEDSEKSADNLEDKKIAAKKDLSTGQKNESLTGKKNETDTSTDTALAATQDGKDQSPDENKKKEETESEYIERVREKVQQIVKSEGVNAPDVQIKGDKNGTVITLFDKSKIGMFNIGSARPSPELVRIMKKIGEILSRQKGKIIVGGHTDGRKFNSDTYDNWRLSTARAHMAYHMLVRGGVEEGRFEMIQGFGDVKLAVPEDPFSPINRRIEISLRIS